VSSGARGDASTAGDLVDKLEDVLVSDQTANKQLLHLVFGGELAQMQGVEFKDLARLDIVGIYPNYAAAYAAWRAKAQQTVDNAHMRYFIVHLHRLLDPDSTDQLQSR
jgi:hypothetical protein